MAQQAEELVDRGEIVRLLTVAFKARFGDRMFQYAVRALGLKPTCIVRLEPPRKGRVGLYDPIVAWLIASVNSRCKGHLEGMSNALEPYRQLWDSFAHSADARAVPGFADDREYGAELLMLTSPDYGMPLAALFRAVQAEPELLDLSAFGREYLENVFLAYKEAYIAALEGMQFDTMPDQPTADEQRHAFAETWLHRAAVYMSAPDPAEIPPLDE